MSLTSARVDAYRRNKFYTADRGTLLLMLYQGAVQFLKRAKEHLQKGEIAEKGVYISKAHAIVSEFVCTLDSSAGSDLARGLQSLYNFVLDRLMSAHLGNDIKALDEALSILETLKEGWEGAVVTARREGLI